MELLWALPSSLVCFFSITQDIMDISCFMIILYPSVTEAVLIPKQANTVIVSQMVCT